METLLYILVYSIGGILTAAGLFRFIGYRLRLRRCTQDSSGSVIDFAEKRNFLSWPSTCSYYPIFEYGSPNGGTEIQASIFPAQFKNQIDQSRSYTVKFDPQKPSVFICPDWDRNLSSTALGQLFFGIAIIVITLVLSLR